MICIEGCILTIEFSENLNYSIRIQYLAAAQAAGLMLMNSMACRVFRSLRQPSPVEETILSSAVASNMVFSTVFRRGDMHMTEMFT